MPPATDPAPNQLKKAAAAAALAEVEPGMHLGLGTGSTVAHLLDLLAEQVKAGLDVVGVPTSVETADSCRRLGIPLASLDDLVELDLCIDGADEVTPNLDLIKGLGGALLRERVVADASERFVVIADERKAVARLGERSPVPVEVVPFARPRVAHVLADLEPSLRAVDDEAVVTDNGNVLLDLHTGPLDAPRDLATRLDATPGVVDHGLFLDMADAAYVAGPSGVRKLEN